MAEQGRRCVVEVDVAHEPRVVARSPRQSWATGVQATGGATLRVMKRPTVASNVEWLQYGAEDPFWGVASWNGREKNGDNPWSAEESYELGRQDWRDFRRHWRDYGMQGGVAAEIGCGAGRLTMHMAEDFTRVIGIDVSEGMLATARQHVDGPTIDFRR